MRRAWISALSPGNIPGVGELSTAMSAMAAIATLPGTVDMHATRVVNPKSLLREVVLGVPA